MTHLRRKSKTESGAVMTKREAVKKKPLVERAVWSEHPFGKVSEVDIAGVTLTVWHGRPPYTASATLGFPKGWTVLDAETPDEAKAEALRIVQKAVLKAAEAWSD